MKIKFNLSKDICYFASEKNEKDVKIKKWKKFSIY